MTSSEAIKQLAQLLADQAEAGSRVWDIATALRGPDNDDDQTLTCNCDQQDCPKVLNLRRLKSSTTSVIRHQLLKLAYPNEPVSTADWHFGFFFNADSEEAAKFRRDLDHIGGTTKDLYHFRDHAYTAFHALNLKWDAVNVPEGSVQRCA